jgi:two-component system, cell cycle sensor histidine kinase and response regulator CckA
VIAEVHPDDLAGVQEAIRRALEDNEPYTVRYRIIPPDGRLVWLEANGRVRRDERGRPLSMAGVCMDVSDRRRLEEEREASEERYRRIVESLPFATYLSDFDTDEALYISPQHAELTGREPAWFLGPGSLKRYRSLVHPDDRERITRAREEWSAAGGAGEYRTEHRIVRADGELRYVDSSAFRIGRDLHGRELVQGFLIDVTERRRLDQALRESEERYRRMVEMAAHGIALLDLDGLVVDINPAVERLLGYPREEIIGRPCEPFTHPDDHSRESPLLDATRAGAREGYALEKRYLRKDGTSVWASLALRLIRDERGEPNQLLALIEDISERKRARIALEESETRLRLISEQLPGIVWTTDCELKITSVSGTLNRELMEPRFGDITGTLVGERGVTAEKFVDAHLRVIASGAAETLEFIWQGRALEARIEPLVIGDEIAGAVGLAIDRSEQREIERRMQQAAQLQALGRLARGIAHDFNNLLASIQIAADLAHERVQDEQVRAELDVARTSVAHGAEMVRQLLAFGRQQPVEQRPVDLDELIDQTEPVLARLVGEKRIALERRREGNAVVVVADPSQLSQVAFNLVANARDAIEDEGRIILETGIVELDLARADERDVEPGRFGKLAVSDTGAGMDAETMARVFEPFFTTKPQGKGTGLGLATVYGIVEQAGGAVELASEPRQGSTFTVLLPLAETAAERVPVDRNGAGETADDPPTILLVEDEPGVRVLTSRLLERRGYPHFTAENGEAALALLAGVEQPIDLLLTDVRMPRLGGGDLARRLRAQNPRLPVILMSGDIRDEADLEGLDAGKTAFLAKPFTVAELERTIAALFEPSALASG